VDHRGGLSRQRFLPVLLVVGLTACAGNDAPGGPDDATGEGSDGTDLPDDATATDDSATLDDSDPDFDLDSDGDADSSDAVPDGLDEQGPYDPCGTPDVGPCRSDLQCLAIPGMVGTRPFCSPPCGSDGSCPPREGVEGYCALGASGGDPTLCGLLCDPAGSAVCPSGMTCTAVTGGGLCLWPA